jgi:hypothetical protein
MHSAAGIENYFGSTIRISSMHTISQISTALVAALVTVAAPALARAEAPEARSPATATALSLAPLGATLALGAAAGATESDALAWVAVGTFVVGPSLGHFYAGSQGRGIATTAARAGGLGLMATGFALAFADSWNEDDEDDHGALAGLAMVTGVSAVIAATVYDIVDAAPAARRFNSEIAVTPTVVGGAAGNAPGMAISGRF